MNNILRTRLCLTGLLVGLILLTTGCPTTYSGDIKAGSRVLRVDIANRIFDAHGTPEDEKSVWGMGASRITVTVHTGSGSFEEKQGTTGLEEVFDYTPLEINIEGQLESIDVAVTGTNEFSASIDSVASPEYWDGWQVFANLERFRVHAEIDPDHNSDSRLNIDAAPSPGIGLRGEIGVTDPDYAVTDRGQASELESGHVSLQPVFREHPSGLEYYLYYAVVEENLKAEYGIAENPDEAGYYTDPWEDVWTVEEMTETGKMIGGTRIELIHADSEPRDPLNPMGEDDDYLSVLVDLTKRGTFPEQDLGKYLVGGLVIAAGDLQVTSRMVCIEIR